MEEDHPMLPSPLEEIKTLEMEEVEPEEEEAEYEKTTEDEDDESGSEPKEQPEPQNPKPNKNPNPSVPESIAHLQSMNTVISSFLHHYSSLHQTLDSISSTISPSAPQNIEPTDLKIICQCSAAKPLRKYISAHLSDPDSLRQEVSEAIKLSPDPANFILNSVGRFYLRGKKAYLTRGGDSQAIEARRVSILLLEIYMIAGCPVTGSSERLKKVEESAMKAAAAWRNRLMSEGGVEGASTFDALGLVLLVGGFGVPQEFRKMDLYRLLKLSNLKKNGDVLRRSRVLVEKIPDMIKDLTAKEMHVEAVDLIYAFGLEEKISPLPLLSSFVKKTCEVGLEERREGQCLTRPLKEAIEKQSSALKSVLNCLEYHKIDATELSSLSITQEIAKREEILKFDRKLQEKNPNLKRKAENVGPPRNQRTQAKPIRPFSAEASRGPPFPQPIRPAQDQGLMGSSITDSRYPYNGGYIPRNVPVFTEVSPGLPERNNAGLLAYQNSPGQNYYQPPVAGKSYFQHTVAGQNYYQSSGQQQYYQTPPSSAVTGAGNFYQFVGTVPQQELPSYITASSTALPNPATTVADPSHQLSYMG